MVNGKERTKTHIIDNKAITIIKQRLPETWVIRDLTPDYGFDLDVELFVEEQGKNVTLGEHLFIQAKGTTNAKYRTIKCNYDNIILEKRCLAFSLDTALLRLVERIGNSLPVLLVTVDVELKEEYFVCLNDYIDFVLSKEPTWRKKKTKTIYVPCENRLTNDKLLRLYAVRPKLNSFFAEVAALKNDLKYMSKPQKFIGLVMQFAQKYQNSDIWNVILLGLSYFAYAKESVDLVANNVFDTYVGRFCLQENEYYNINCQTVSFENLSAAEGKKVLICNDMIERIDETINSFLTGVRRLYIIDSYEAIISAFGKEQ